MPKNNKLEKVKLPMPLRFNEAPTTEFRNNLESLKITLLDYPSVEQLRSYLAPFLEATWADDPLWIKNASDEEKDKVIQNCFDGNSLPAALETVGLTFLIEGISLQEVTHILRHRTATFSAECSGDKWWTHKKALVPNSIQNSDEFYVRYKKIVEDSKKLYCDMIDSKSISIMDARYILPRCLETYYFMRISMKEIIGFIFQRQDRQIQPETDNVIAYLMALELVDKIPYTRNMFNFEAPSSYYIKMARTGKATNLYFPDQYSDKFEYNENDFIYQCTRDQMNGTNKGARNLFNEIFDALNGRMKRFQNEGK